MWASAAFAIACASHAAVAFVPQEYSNPRDSNDTKPIRQTTYPDVPIHQSGAQPLIDGIRIDRMQDDMKNLTHYHNRYYKSDSGVQASDWIYEQIKRYDGSLKYNQIRHDWPQRSIIVQVSEGTVRKKKDRRVIAVGAHLDSIGVQDGRVWANYARAPGADDNASGVAVLLEALRLLAKDHRKQNFRNAVEFHFYAAEEVGLKGSEDIFEDYSDKRTDVVAFLNQDMAGAKAADGSDDVFTIVQDYVYAPLNDFISKIIATYTNLGTRTWDCGRPCSDHASATEEGFPAAWITHSQIGNSSYIHTARDRLDRIDYDHMAEHVKLVIGFVYELAFAEIGPPKEESDGEQSLNGDVDRDGGGDE